MQPAGQQYRSGFVGGFAGVNDGLSRSPTETGSVPTPGRKHYRVVSSDTIRNDRQTMRRIARVAATAAIVIVGLNLGLKRLQPGKITTLTRWRG